MVKGSRPPCSHDRRALKMRDVENATRKCSGGKCEQKFRMESHNNVVAAEYIFCSFMHKTRHIVFSAQKYHIWRNLKTKYRVTNVWKVPYRPVQLTVFISNRWIMSKKILLMATFISILACGKLSPTYHQFFFFNRLRGFGVLTPTNFATP